MNIKNKAIKRINWLDHLIGLLVVIFGITIAFYLNSWNEARHVERQERKILTSFLMDLREDSINLQQLIDTTLYMEKKSAMLLKLFQKQDRVSNDSLFFYIIPLYSYYKFSPQDVTYNSMIFSGKLEVISDFNLSKGIVSLYSGKYEDLATLDELHKKEVFELKIPYLHSKILLQNLNPSNSLFSETLFQNYAYGTNYFFRNKKTEYGKAYLECCELIDEIQAKLSNR